MGVEEPEIVIMRSHYGNRLVVVAVVGLLIGCGGSSGRALNASETQVEQNTNQVVEDRASKRTKQSTDRHPCDPAPAVSCGGALRLTLVDDTRPAGISLPSFACTNDELNVYHRASSENDVPQRASITEGGLGPSEPLTAFEGHRGTLDSVVGASGSKVLFVTGHVVSPGDHDIVAHLDESASEPFAVRAAPGVDAEPVVASGDDGLFGVAWRTPTELVFASITPHGRSNAVVIERDMSVSGHALVNLPEGWALIAGRSFEGHVVYHRLSKHGVSEVRREVLLDGHFLRAVWDGEAIAMVLSMRSESSEPNAEGLRGVPGAPQGYTGRGYRPRPQQLAFVRISSEGRLLTEPVPFPSAAQTTSLVYDGEHYWVATGAGWSPVVAESSPIYMLNRDGSIEGEVDLEVSARYVALAPFGGVMHGAVVDRTGQLHSFIIDCET